MWQGAIVCYTQSLMMYLNITHKQEGNYSLHTGFNQILPGYKWQEEKIYKLKLISVCFKVSE